MEVLAGFQIKNDQIYSITTDNGTNMLKAINIIASENGEYEVLEAETDFSGECEWGENLNNVKIVVENNIEASDSINTEEQEVQHDIFKVFHENCMEGQGLSTSTLKVTSK